MVTEREKLYKQWNRLMKQYITTRNLEEMPTILRKLEVTADAISLINKTK